MATKKTTTKKKETALDKLLAPFNKYMKESIGKQWKSGTAKCLSCGNTWRVIYLNIQGGESKLECPKCKKRNSKIV